jgi:hypothetical protein
VFSDRYHLEVITSPTRARHAISCRVAPGFAPRGSHGSGRAGLLHPARQCMRFATDVGCRVRRVLLAGDTASAAG